MLKILHTSDWHLGKSLCGESLISAMERALEWLLELCRDRGVDCVLLAGDVFESASPAPAAQRLYYQFLARAAEAGGSVVVAPGNHDDAAFLRAASGLFSSRGVFVAGASADEEAIVLRDPSGKPLAGIAALPALTEAEARRELLKTSGRVPEERASAYEQGLAARFLAVRRALDEKLAGAKVPRIAMGHFYASGAVVRGGGEPAPEELGGLPAVSAAAPGEGWDYVALGHVHEPQALENPAVRYSGAPWPLAFKDAGRSLGAVIVTLESREAPVVEPVTVPAFQPLARAEGDCDGLQAALERIARENPGAWVEAVYTGVTERPDLEASLRRASAKLGLRLFGVSNPALFKKARKAVSAGLETEPVTPSAAFKQLLLETRENDAVLKQLAETFSEAMSLQSEQDGAAEVDASQEAGGER